MISGIVNLDYILKSTLFSFKTFCGQFRVIYNYSDIYFSSYLVMNRHIFSLCWYNKIFILFLTLDVTNIFLVMDRIPGITHLHFYDRHYSPLAVSLYQWVWSIYAWEKIRLLMELWIIWKNIILMFFFSWSKDL